MPIQITARQWLNLRWWPLFLFPAVLFYLFAYNFSILLIVIFFLILLIIFYNINHKVKRQNESILSLLSYDQWQYIKTKKQAQQQLIHLHSYWVFSNHIFLHFSDTQPALFLLLNRRIIGEYAFSCIISAIKKQFNEIPK